MKIAMFGHKRIPGREGGVEVVVEELATGMAARGHQVICYNRSGRSADGTKPEASPVYRGVRCKRVWTLDKKGLAAVTSSFSAAVCAAFSRAEVVHIHAEGPAFMCWLPRLFGKRVIVTVHGLDWQREKWKGGFGSRYIRAGEKMAVRFADEIIVLSRSAQAYFRKTYGRETVYIPNGVQRPEIVAPALIGEKYGLKKDEYILFLGRLVPEKGVHYLVDAFRQLHTDKKLVVAGDTSDTDEYVKTLKAAAEGDARILFTGFVRGRELQELYSNAYVYALPSDVEGMPLSLLEAMSYGNCCLTSDIPECAEVVDDRAVTFEKSNVDHLRRQLQSLCDDPAAMDALRENAREYICAKYHWDDVVDKTLEIYR